MGKEGEMKKALFLILLLGFTLLMAQEEDEEEVDNTPATTRQNVVNDSSILGNYAIDVRGGLLTPIGRSTDYWNNGYGGGATFWYKVTPNFYLGANGNYYTGDMDGDKMAGDTEYPDYKWSTSSSYSVMELSPAARLIALDGIYFVQLSTGVAFYKQKYTLTPPTGYGIEEIKLDEDYQKLCATLGLGLTLYKHIEVLPQYHIIWTNDRATRYFSFNLGAKF